MRVLDDIKELLEDELKKIAKKGDISPTELENVYKAVKTINYATIIDAMEEEKESGYSQRGYSRGMGAYAVNGGYPGSSYDGSYGSYNSYDGSMSNRGGMGMSNDYSRDGRAGRDGDSDGRYSETGSYAQSNRGGSSMDGYANRGYSRHTEKEKMIEKLEGMMNTVSNEKERQAIMQCISKLEG